MNLVIPEKLAPKRRRSWLPRAWRTPLALVGTVIALVWILVAILAPWIAPHDPLAQDLPRLAAPSGDAIMGTDVNGRDVFSRLLLGAQTTIPLALMLVVCAMVVGTIVGAVAGYLGGWVDEVLMRITDMVMAFPTVILAMVIAASLGPSIMNAVIAGIIVAWPPYARITRSLVLGLRTQNYVVAGRLLGSSPLRSLARDVLPNIAGPVLVLASLDIGTAILLLSGLSFLGLGAQPPTPEWGTMIAAAMQNTSAWWLGLFPGLAILSIVMAFNFIGDSLRDALDPLAAREREAEAPTAVSAAAATGQAA
ncbi:ABC transporter permease [Microbacterium azadirachtae]|uniref:Putative D,D-dipeptide transport system permease protein DdpC n=1 Tax=Microbacterium azadirachtae TaxID=582680 RepID=A0A0F0KYG9_9MICO|nr:ABC transporter permease [Microbacterium azadirachtae]KJL25155.1 putative D,D-dipeptide transport system permease protein DdpC [Microbacterium azadirachtae]UXW85978.1 ABC transporter permease [Microbacterium azadirachtae]SDL66917.1 peptide/nickel transport system permease protein [Microbacterium azadirachtae]SEF96417.1 peptide/nickel transport system permease protein [Microbacterium azadirachtae]SEF98832.1 peptide/nickel transport system permease protein [Microbacterium azadirachtae]